MIPKAIQAALLAASVTSACATARPAPPEPKRLRVAVVADSIIHLAMRETHWGIEVWDQARNQPLYSHNAERRFIPASNTKLVATIAGMGLLGPDWRYVTPFMVTGAPGDTAPRALIVKGTGDPTWSARFHASDLTVFESIADSLVKQGIGRIAGDVFIDATAFPGTRINGSWEIDDLPWYYAAPTGAFAIGEARMLMITNTGTEASHTSVRFVNGDPAVPVVSRIAIVTGAQPGDPDVDITAFPDSLVLVGNSPPNMVDTSRISIRDPELHAARTFVRVLSTRGIEVNGFVRILHDSASVAALPPTRTVATWSSPPLNDIVAAILKPSQNWIADQLLKTLGAVKGRGGSWGGGLAVERRYLIDVVHIDSAQFSLADGSGLAARNLVSPHALVQMLEHARTSPWGEQYRLALPAPGMSGSTLSTRLKGLEDRVFAKTGTIANVNSLSGYIRADDGRNLTFAIMTNAAVSANTRAAVDALVRALAAERDWD